MIAKNEIKRNSTAIIACTVLLNIISHVSNLPFFFLHKLFSLTIQHTANVTLFFWPFFRLEMGRILYGLDGLV